jgi:hypothetical protein
MFAFYEPLKMYLKYAYIFISVTVVKELHNNVVLSVS